MKKEVVKVAAWCKEFGVRSVECAGLPQQFHLNHLDVQGEGVWSEELRKARLTLNSGGEVLQGQPPSVSTPKQASANVRVADRSTRLPTFSWHSEVRECQRSVSRPKQASANIQLADRSKRAPTFS